MRKWQPGVTTRVTGDDASFAQAPDAILMHALPPIVKSFEPDEDWSGCYADEVEL